MPALCQETHRLSGGFALLGKPGIGRWPLPVPHANVAILCDVSMRISTFDPPKKIPAQTELRRRTPQGSM